MPSRAFLFSVGVETIRRIVSAIGIVMPARAFLFSVPYLGALTPGGYKQPMWDGTLKLSFEFNATSKAFLDALIAPTANAPVQKQVRIKHTSGTAIVQYDFCGTAINAPKVFTDQSGVASVDLELHGTYHTTVANWFKASITNSVATLV